MTERLYYKNQYLKKFTANTVSCVQKDDKFEIILDRSAFFPEGGGQPGDRGKIGKAEVLDTVERDGEEIHICDRAEDGECSCEIDWSFRFLNMQQHTGEHIFSGFVHGKFGYDNVGFHMGENEVTVDFNGPVDSKELAEIERLTNEAVWKNIPVETLCPERAELSKYNYRSKKEIEGSVRLVKIGDIDLCACCGTHTAFTGEVGMVKAVACMNYKQGVRITLKIGGRALEDYCEKTRSVTEISNLLCAKPNEVADAVIKQKEKLNEVKIKLNEEKHELFNSVCENIGEEFPVAFDNSGTADDARVLADILAKKVKVAYAFSGSDEGGYKYAVASAEKDVRQEGKKINAALNGKGGGKPEMIMGSVNCVKSEIIAYFKQ